MPKKIIKKGKKPHRNKPTSKKYSKYKIDSSGKVFLTSDADITISNNDDYKLDP